MSETPYFRYSSDKLGFYVAASDQDMLTQLNRLLSRNGYVGVMDTAGRLQYLIDGRRGLPFAVRRIVETAGQVISDHHGEYDVLCQYLSAAVDEVLAGHDFRPELKGYRYLRYMLLDAGLDGERLRPVSKTLYPAAAVYFKVSLSQVERDVRYLLQKSDLYQQGLSAAAAICRLHDEMLRQAEQLSKKEISPAIDENDRGRY